MKVLQKYLKRHRPRLLQYLDEDTKIPRRGTEILNFVDSLLEEWDEKLRDRHLPPQNRQEMSFWFCLYKLETLAEIDPTLPLHPFEKMMFEDLRVQRERFRRNLPLSKGCYATRPTPDYDEHGEIRHDDMDQLMLN